MPTNPHFWVRHPQFDEYWEKHRRLIWFFAVRVAKQGRSVDTLDLLGSLTILFNRLLHTYDPGRGKFAAYLGHAVNSHLARTFFRYESEERAVRYYAHMTKDTERQDACADCDLDLDLIHQDQVQEVGEDWPEFDFDDTGELWAFLTSSLTPRYKGVLTRRYRDGRSLKQTGDEYEISRERVRQLEANAVRKIQFKLKWDMRFWDMFHKKQGEDDDLDD